MFCFSIIDGLKLYSIPDNKSQDLLLLYLSLAQNYGSDVELWDYPSEYYGIR